MLLSCGRFLRECEGFIEGSNYYSRKRRRDPKGLLNYFPLRTWRLCAAKLLDKDLLKGVNIIHARDAESAKACLIIFLCVLGASARLIYWIRIY